MTELYLVELLGYLDARRILLGEDNDGEEMRVRRVWHEHFNYEVDNPGLFHPDQVHEVYGTAMVPVHWGSAVGAGAEVADL